MNQINVSNTLSVINIKHEKLRICTTKVSKYVVFQYNIKKKEEVVESMPQEEPNPLMRKKKTPEELAAEAEAEDEDEFTSEWKDNRRRKITSCCILL